MKAVNDMKPVNVLARYIAAWIKDHSSDGKPFSSFETLRDDAIEQKDVERWLLNCNYTYYRLGEALFVADLFPESAEGTRELLHFLDEDVKSIRDTNPLKLRSKQPAALVDELGKDWPPFRKGSRNTVSKAARALQSCATRASTGNPDLFDHLEIFASELTEETRWYQALARRTAGRPVADRCRALLPLWCAKEINPLFSLLLWEDEHAVSELADELSRSFAANGYPSFDGGSRHDAYQGVVSISQQLFKTGLNASDGRDPRALSIPHIADLLEYDLFSLERPCPLSQLPAWLPGKALLIWNVAICSILGPREALRPLGLNRTATTLKPASSASLFPAARGEVLLRRQLQGGECELVSSVDLSEPEPRGTVALNVDSSAERLWLVLGSTYDEAARIPDPLVGAETSIAGRFCATARLDSRGNQIEGMGDSRYHAALTLSRSEGHEGEWSPRLLDLGSKNGTYVVRMAGGHATYYVLQARSPLRADAWAERMHVPACDVHVVDWLELMRGDLIQLCGSCFELL